MSPKARLKFAPEKWGASLGNVVVSDPAIATVANVPRADQVVFAELDVRAVGDRRTAATPVPGQREAGVLVDDVDHRGFQLVGVDLLRVDPAQRLRCCESGRVTRGLAWTKVAAIAEDGEQIALDGVR